MMDVGIYDYMCDYVKIRLEFNKGQTDHIVSYKIGKVICRHVNDSLCVQLDEDKLPLTISSHSPGKYIYYMHKSRVDTTPFRINDPLFNIRNKLLKLRFYIVDIINGINITHIRQYQHHPTNIHTYLDVDECDMIKLTHKNTRIGYENYHGITKFNGVFFEKKNHAYLQMYDSLIGIFQSVEMNEPPSSGSLICGIPEKNEVGEYLSHWFRCSQQFYILYQLLTIGKTHDVFRGKNKNQILDMLETNPSLKTISPPSVKAMNYIHLDTEPSSVRYCDIYKAIAEIFYFQSDVPINMRKIPESYRVPSTPEIYVKSLLHAFG